MGVLKTKVKKDTFLAGLLSVMLLIASLPVAAFADVSPTIKGGVEGFQGKSESELTLLGGGISNEAGENADKEISNGTEDNTGKGANLSNNDESLSEEKGEATTSTEGGDGLAAEVKSEKLGISLFSETTTLQSVAELSAALTGGSTTIYLSDAFVNDMLTTGVARAQVSINNDVTIEGSTLSQELVAKAGNLHFDITNNGTGSITLAHLNLNGNNAGGGIRLGGSAPFVVRESEFTRVSNSALWGGAVVLVENCIFRNIHASLAGSGAAITIGTATYTIRDCSFIDNSTTWGGYSGGAIFVGNNSTASVTIERSYFLRNSYTGSATGSGGGAIGWYSALGSLTINACVFEGNTTTARTDISDGGAISFVNRTRGVAASLAITDSTFNGNTAEDDGGAIIVEGNSGAFTAVHMTAAFTNCTFFENTAKGVGDAGGNGGAVQVFGAASLTATSNTFVQNTAPSTGTSAGGGALSRLGSLTTRLLIQNNLFYGNSAAEGMQQTILGTATNNGGNIGNEEQVSCTEATLFGVKNTNKLTLASNGTTRAAGSRLHEGYSVPLQTILIAPRLADDGQVYTNGAAQVSPTVTRDQRGEARSTTKPDAGSVEIMWTAFDANGGSWETTPTTEYNHENPLLYVLKGSTRDINSSHAVFDGSKATDAYSVANLGENISALPLQPVHPKGYTFRGWTTVKDDQSTLVTDTSKISAGEQSVYALWRSQTYTVTYHLVDRGVNPATITAPEAEVDKVEGDSYGVEASLASSRKVYIGWKEGEEGTLQSGSPSGVISDHNVDIYLVYGDDTNENMREDVQVIRHFKGIDDTSLTGNGGSSAVTVDLDEGFYREPETGVVEPGWTYVGWNTNGSTSVYASEAPQVALVFGPAIEVYYLYTKTSYTVTYFIEDQGTSSASIPVPAPEVNKHCGDAYGVVAPIAPENKVYRGWKEGSAGKIQEGNPSGVVTGNLDIYLIYGDKASSGEEDAVQITRYFKGTEGTLLTGKLTPQTITLNLKEGFYKEAETGVVEQGWTYVGWNTTGSTSDFMQGSPDIALREGMNGEVYYLYAPENSFVQQDPPLSLRVPFLPKAGDNPLTFVMLSLLILAATVLSVVGLRYWRRKDKRTCV